MYKGLDGTVMTSDPSRLVVVFVHGVSPMKESNKIERLKGRRLVGFSPSVVVPHRLEYQEL